MEGFLVPVPGCILSDYVHLFFNDRGKELSLSRNHDALYLIIQPDREQIAWIRNGSR